MENPVAHRRNAARILTRTLKRLITRNTVWDDVQTGLIGPITPVNEATVLGNSKDSVPALYHYHMYHEKTWYFFDIREFIHQLRLNYNSMNPYTNRPISRFQKYRAVRHYYKVRTEPGFEELIWDTPNHQDHSACLNAFTSAVSRYGITIDLSRVSDQVLLGVVSQMTIWNKAVIPSSALQYTALLNRHYINGNSRAFRSLCYLFLSHTIEGQLSEADKYHIALIMAQRFSYSNTEYRWDPLDPMPMLRLLFTPTPTLIPGPGPQPALPPPVPMPAALLAALLGDAPLQGPDLDDLDSSSDSDSDPDLPPSRRRRLNGDGDGEAEGDTDDLLDQL